MFRRLLLLTLILCSNAHAAPDDAPLERAYNSIYLKEQFQEIRQEVVEHTSGLVATAMGFIGVPYRRGGSSADMGFDCSGLVRTAFQKAKGLVLPRTASEQADATQVIDKKDLRPGDLVFFNTMRRAFSHVGIYVGDGKFLHAPRSGTEVRIESMDIAYWQSRFNGARRVLTDEAH